MAATASVSARLACSGELLTVVDINLDETVANLRSVIAKTAGETCSMWLLTAGRLLLDGELLRDLTSAGSSFAVDIVRCQPMPQLAPPPAAPSNVRVFLRCALTGDAMGEVRLWPLDSVAALREAVLRLCFDDSAATEEGPLQLLLGESCLAGPLPLCSAGVRDGAVLDVLRCEGRCLLTASADGTVRLWDAEHGAHLGSLQQGEWATSLDFHAESLQLAVGLFDCTVKIWSLQHCSCRLTLRGHQGPVMSVAFNVDATLLATGSYDRSARIWRVQDGVCLQSLNGHSDGLNSVSFGNLAPVPEPGADAGPTSCLLTASLDRTARVWHLDAPNDGAAAAAAPAMAHPGEVNSAKFDKDCARICTACADHQVRLWDRNFSCLHVFGGFSSAVSMAMFSPNGSLLCAVGADGEARLWEADGSKEQLLCLKGHHDVATFVTFPPTASVWPLAAATVPRGCGTSRATDASGSSQDMAMP